jgi:hypothetical protein
LLRRNINRRDEGDAEELLRRNINHRDEGDTEGWLTSLLLSAD